MLWHLWIGRARHLGLCLNNHDIEDVNVCGFLAHGDYALDTDASFLAVVGHRLISTRGHCERVALKLRDSSSVGISAAPSPRSSGFSLFGRVRQGTVIEEVVSWQRLQSHATTVVFFPTVCVMWTGHGRLPASDVEAHVSFVILTQSRTRKHRFAHGACCGFS